MVKRRKKIVWFGRTVKWVRQGMTGPRSPFKSLNMKLAKFTTIRPKHPEELSET
jgi:hypothetical protein